jgi:glycerol uptake facilitator-like aquaporin
LVKFITKTANLFNFADDSSNCMISFVLEFIGVLFLSLIAVVQTHNGADASTPIMLAAYTFILYRASTTDHQFHLNPVVTIAIWVNNQLDYLAALRYLAAQFLGAFIGALIGQFICLKSGMDILPRPHIETPALLSIESLLTFILGLVTLLLLRRKSNLSTLAGMYIVSLYAFGKFFITTANPALAIASTMIGQVPAFDGWVFLGAGIFGALAAGTVYTILFGREQPKVLDV